MSECVWLAGILLPRNGGIARLGKRTRGAKPTLTHASTVRLAVMSSTPPVLSTVTLWVAGASSVVGATARTVDMYTCTALQPMVMGVGVGVTHGTEGGGGE